MKKGFDGYYVKCVDDKFVTAVIFGRNVAKKDSVSFVQVITRDSAHWFEFDQKEYNSDKKQFRVSIGNNVVSKEGMTLDLDNGLVKIKCDLKFGPFSPIKYDAMGFFRFFPFMECRHRITSMNHMVSGAFSIDESEHIFDEADGYIEGDWGRSFPKKYLWSQCNSFSENKDLSIAAMCATIPYMGLRFRGKICVIHFEGKEYRLATYRGARVRALEDNRLVVTQGFGRRKKRLEITAVESAQNLNELFAPIRGKMTRIIKETIITTVRYDFTIGGKVIFDVTSDISAFEQG
ncbi:MAG: hypothetical protein FWC00_05020 [Firmicutes bacterium]|nr:hypothetical protein [Bacillota bacterium]